MNGAGPISAGAPVCLSCGSGLHLLTVLARLGGSCRRPDPRVRARRLVALAQMFGAKAALSGDTTVVTPSDSRLAFLLYPLSAFLAELELGQVRQRYRKNFRNGMLPSWLRGTGFSVLRALWMSASVYSGLRRRHA